MNPDQYVAQHEEAWRIFDALRKFTRYYSTLSPTLFDKLTFDDLYDFLYE